MSSNLTHPIVIETNVPIPTGPVERFPFGTLEIGHSFTRPIADKQLLRTHALAYKKAHPGWNYKTATIPFGIRIWRTA